MRPRSSSPIHRLLYSTQFRLIVSIAGLCFLVGLLSLIIGGRLIDRGIYNEAINRIGQDLNSAWEIYSNGYEQIYLGLQLTTLDGKFIDSVIKREADSLLDELQDLASVIPLEFAGIYLAEGTLLRLTSKDASFVDAQIPNPLVGLSMESGAPVWGTTELSGSALRSEDGSLAERASISLVLTPRASQTESKIETSAMVVGACVPILDGNKIVGVMYAGTLLNRDIFVVDRIKETVFKQETYKGIDIGTATIFFKDIRISTNVPDSKGQSAIGTRVSAEVNTQVLGRGERWTGRAFVVNNWYMTAYDPIIDIFGDRIGMLKFVFNFSRCWPTSSNHR